MILNSLRGIAATNRAHCELSEILAPAAMKLFAKKSFQQTILALAGGEFAIGKKEGKFLLRFGQPSRLETPKLLTTFWSDAGIGFVGSLGQPNHTNYSY